MRALHHNTRKICHHNLQQRADLREEEDWRAHPEAKWPSYKINQRVWHYIDARREMNWKFGPSWENQDTEERGQTTRPRPRRTKT
jgi:hypothetical protein